MDIINDAFRVFANKNDLDNETLEKLQNFCREYLLHTQVELCARIKQDFNITVHAAGVRDGGAK
jgi:hypothetical protein